MRALFLLIGLFIFSGCSKSFDRDKNGMIIFYFADDKIFHLDRHCEKLKKASMVTKLPLDEGALNHFAPCAYCTDNFEKDEYLLEIKDKK